MSEGMSGRMSGELLEECQKRRQKTSKVMSEAAPKKASGHPRKIVRKISGCTRERVSDQPSETMSERTQQEKGQPERSPGDMPDRKSP